MRRLSDVWKMLAPPAFRALRSPRRRQRHLAELVPELDRRRRPLLGRLLETGKNNLFETLRKRNDRKPSRGAEERSEHDGSSRLIGSPVNTARPVSIQ